MNLRIDGHFVEDDHWHLAEQRFGTFLQQALSESKNGKKLLLLELGVGFNTPTIIRFPFENLVRKYDNVKMIRLNLNEAVVPESFGDRAVGINADMTKSIRDIVKNV